MQVNSASMTRTDLFGFCIGDDSLQQGLDAGCMYFELAELALDKLSGQTAAILRRERFVHWCEEYIDVFAEWEDGKFVEDLGRYDLQTNMAIGYQDLVDPGVVRFGGAFPQISAKELEVMEKCCKRDTGLCMLSTCR